MTIRHEPKDALTCDKCGLPIESRHIKWTLASRYLTMHAPCALDTARKMKAEVFLLYNTTGKHQNFQTEVQHNG